MPAWNLFNPTSQKGDSQSAASGQSGLARLEAGRVYTGVITQTHHGDGLYTVKIDGINTVINCTWAAGIFSPLLGIRTKYYPALDTKVAVLVSGLNTGWIITTAPSESYDQGAGGANSMVDMQLNEEKLEPFEQELKGVGLNVTNPNDLLEGEFVIANNFGVAIQFLTTMIKMQASERAKVEALLMDDMVRIVSETFKHYSSFGDYQIYNDGRLNVRFDGTSYEFESFGKEKNTDPLVQLDDKKVDFQKTFNETGRWRFSEYIGFLGDFIHTFVTEPNETLAAIAAEAIRPGKARMQMHSDGTILMQSVADISIERVCRVVSPAEIRRQDDPEGNKKNEFDKLNKEYLKIWSYGQDMRKAHYASYQLRQYARWLSCFHSFARFHQLDKDWSVPKETDFQHSWNNQEEDVEQANAGGETLYDVYATFRIMRDGSILIMDGFNSAISMVRGSIQMSAARHIELDAAGDIRINAGQNIYIKARRNIEISAIVGGLTLKARAWWKALCEWGTVWIKSDAIDPLSGDTPPTPEDPTQDPEPEIHGAAIFLDAAKGQTLIQSERRTTISVIGNPEDTESLEDTTSSVVLQSKNQDVRSIGARHVILKSEGRNQGKIVLDSVNAIAATTMRFLLKVKLIFDINKKFTMRSDNIVNVEEIRSKRAHAQQTISGPENKGVDHEQDNIPHHGHGHHIMKFNGAATPIEFADSDEVKQLEDYTSSEVVEVNPHEAADDPADGPDWEYTPEDKNFDNQGYAEQPKEDETFQPMAQQRLAESGTDNLIDKSSYEDWDWETDNKLKAGTRTNTSSLPFPGAAAQEKKFTDGKPLHQPLDEEYSAQSPDKAQDPVNQSITRKFIKYS
jgi:hypothetical protein